MKRATLWLIVFAVFYLVVFGIIARDLWLGHVDVFDRVMITISLVIVWCELVLDELKKLEKKVSDGE